MSRRAWFAFATVALLWGLPYFFIKVAVAEVAPPIVSETRLAVGAIILLPLAWRRSALGAAWARWPWVVGLGIGYLAVALTLIPLAETFVSSSLTAVLIATVPMIVAIISLLWERPTATEMIGLVVGFAGVAMLVGLDVSVDRWVAVGAALLLVVVVAYALGPIVSARKLSGVQPLGYMSLAMVVAALVLMPLAVAERPTRMPSEPVLLSLLALGILCTAIPYALYFQLVADAGPQRATLVTYVNPAVAVLLGALVLHEQVTATMLFGMALILVGSWLATRGRTTPSADVGLRNRPGRATPARR